MTDTPRSLVPSDDRSDEDLLHDAAAGEQEAFVSFCADRLPSLRSYVSFLCRRYNIPEDQIDDIVQETLLRVLRKGGQQGRALRLAEIPLAYLKRIGKNLVVDWLRRRRSLTPLPLEAAEGVASPNPPGEPTVDEWLSWLPESDGKIIRWLLFDNLTGAEAAERLGISRGTVYQRYRRALAHLGEVIDLHNEGAGS